MTDKWGREAGINLIWTQEEYGAKGEHTWTSAHGMVWSIDKPSRYLATVYVHDKTYAISVFGLYGLTLKQHKVLTQYLENELGMTKRVNRVGV